MVKLEQLKLTGNVSKTVLYILKLVVSITAIWLLSEMFGKKEIVESVKKSQLYIIGISLLLYIVSQYLSTLRLGMLLHKAEVNISVAQNFKLYFIGMAYNLFLPGGIGGDGYKLYIYKKIYKGIGKHIFSSLLLERLLGLSIILSLVAALIPFMDLTLPYKNRIGMLAPVVLFLSKVIYNHFFKSFKTLLVKGLWLSIAIQLIQILAVILLAYSLGINAWLDIAGIFLLSTLATAIPLFLGGVGAREVVFGLMSNYVGIDSAAAIATAVLFSLISIVSAIPGLFFDWTLKRKID